MGTEGHAETVRRYWAAAEARDWKAFAATLSPDVVYRCPQTREVVRGREAYLRFNREFPGDWHLVVDRVLVDDGGAMSRTTFTVGGETMTGLCLFTMDADGLVAGVEDWWPEPYERPAERAHLSELET
ncbi:nuclear transport factor 2 family protein [Phycicoccus sonneratiae]|uniref:Nuclear transport factor 2 family protein n=1 Tax=Phycicoccus sonneratiae TaxID=2807628 RepID=A0ABS2CKK7_9MICO|nr:nuclear transport factor 2 family protein [Phycicoccus sonneraticus]MBM6400416.1 nuclear transport factor 2 family protein [Phycicoccus sonneraticus]